MKTSGTVPFRSSLRNNKAPRFVLFCSASTVISMTTLALLLIVRRPVIYSQVRSAEHMTYTTFLQKAFGLVICSVVTSGRKYDRICSYFDSFRMPLYFGIWSSASERLKVISRSSTDSTLLFSKFLVSALPYTLIHVSKVQFSLFLIVLKDTTLSASNYLLQYIVNTLLSLWRLATTAVYHNMHSNLITQLKFISVDLDVVCDIGRHYLLNWSPNVY